MDGSDWIVSDGISASLTMFEMLVALLSMVGSLLAGKTNPFQQERVKKTKSLCLYPRRGYFGFVSSNKRGVFCHKNKKSCNLLDLLLPISIHCEDIRLVLSAVLHRIFCCNGFGKLQDFN